MHSAKVLQKFSAAGLGGMCYRLGGMCCQVRHSSLDSLAGSITLVILVLPDLVLMFSRAYRSWMA
jgi:hypothetical protein